jgi:ATP-dependent helicase HrpB
MPREALPIDPLLPQIVANLRERSSLVLRADTGAGKTTRVPPALLPAIEGKIVMLEPRRVAARAAARRIAQENGWELGREVGYQVRFERRAGRDTRILVVTEGILVQLLQQDPFLDGIGCVILDEQHERHLTTDLSLAMARKVQLEARPDLRLLVMSATLDPARLLSFLGPETAVIDAPGRLFPVEVEYLERPDARGLPTLVKTAAVKLLESTPGDLLVFLPGVGEINRCREFLEPLAKSHDLKIMPLYGDLPPEQQDAALQRGARRRIVLATNVAESSVTLAGVTAVIDSGQARYLRYDPALGLDRLELGRISKASAEQRKGRAGREAPGRCLRLWTAADQRSLAERDVPEIKRVDLAGTALELLAWGESDLAGFPFFEKPEPAALERALELLDDLGAVKQGALTPLGKLLAQLPVHPRLGRLIVEGRKRGETRRAALLAALLSERDIVFRPTEARPVQAAASTESDLIDRLEAIETFTARGYAETVLGPVDGGRARGVLRVGQQLLEAAEKRLSALPEGDFEEDSNETLRRCLLAAYPDRVAKRREPGGRRVVLAGGRGAKLAEMSSVHGGDLLLAVELDGGAAGERSEALIRQASSIEAEWLEGKETRTEAFFDPVRERVVGLRRTYYRDLAIAESEVDPGPREAEKKLAEAAAGALDRALPLADPEVESWLARVRSLAGWMPELGLPSFGEGELKELLPELAAGRRSFAELKKAPLLATLENQLPWKLRQELERLAPARLEVPSGSAIRLAYEPGKSPILAARIQELFGWAETPRIAAGRVPVLLHLLAPNYRPQQVTQDLASFWKNTYPEVRKELAHRYPKHSWPLDPWTATPQRKGPSQKT